MTVENNTTMVSDAFTNKEKKIDYISLASVISAIAVVHLHANSCFWEFSATERYWKTANIIESVFYYAVPIFFMITGATLIDFYERYELKEFFRKRVNKAVIPYLFWSLIGFFYIEVVLNGTSVSNISIKEIINGLITGKLVSIYWFFIPLFCVYLCIPLFAAVEKKRKEKILFLLACIAFFINILVPFIKSIMGIMSDFPWRIDVAAGYLFYVLIGYLIVKKDISRTISIVVYCLGVLGLSLHVFGTYYMSINAGSLVQIFKGYNNIPCVLYSCAIFVFVKQIGGLLMQDSKLSKVISFLARYTFPIYLLHYYVLATIVKMGADTHSIIYRLLATYVAIIVAIVITIIIRKIPMARNILPD